MEHTMAATHISVNLKLVIDAKNQRVLYAEADKKAVDFLFHILTLPMATVISLLKKQQMTVGCIANLYDSVGNLCEYIQTSQYKENILQPRISVNATFSSSPLSLPQDDLRKFPKYGYRCPNCQSQSYCKYSDYYNVVCPNCRKNMTGQMTYAAPSMNGFMKDAATFMVMDDLVVKPMATTSTISLLNKFNVKDVGTVEEKFVNIGFNEALNLVKASLTSNRVLTTLFL